MMLKKSLTYKFKNRKMKQTILLHITDADILKAFIAYLEWRKDCTNMEVATAFGRVKFSKTFTGNPTSNDRDILPRHNGFSVTIEAKILGANPKFEVIIQSHEIPTKESDETDKFIFGKNSYITITSAFESAEEELNPVYIANFGEVFRKMNIASIAKQAAAVHDVELVVDHENGILPKMPGNFIYLVEAQHRKFYPSLYTDNPASIEVQAEIDQLPTGDDRGIVIIFYFKTTEVVAKVNGNSKHESADGTHVKLKIDKHLGS